MLCCIVSNSYSVSFLFSFPDKDVSCPTSSVPPSALSDDGEDRSQGSGGESSSLRYAYKDDQRNHVNTSGKKTYDRNFLLELQNYPASMKKPDDLPSLEDVRDKAIKPVCFNDSNKIIFCY